MAKAKKAEANTVDGMSRYLADRLGRASLAQLGVTLTMLASRLAKREHTACSIADAWAAQSLGPKHTAKERKALAVKILTKHDGLSADMPHERIIELTIGQVDVAMTDLGFR